MSIYVWFPQGNPTTEVQTPRLRRVVRAARRSSATWPKLATTEFGSRWQNSYPVVRRELRSYWYLYSLLKWGAKELLRVFQSVYSSACLHSQDWSRRKAPLLDIPKDSTVEDQLVGSCSFNHHLWCCLTDQSSKNERGVHVWLPEGMIPCFLARTNLPPRWNVIDHCTYIFVIICSSMGLPFFGRFI